MANINYLCRFCLVFQGYQTIYMFKSFSKSQSILHISQPNITVYQFTIKVRYLQLKKTSRISNMLHKKKKTPRRCLILLVLNSRKISNSLNICFQQNIALHMKLTTGVVFLQTKKRTHYAFFFVGKRNHRDILILAKFCTIVQSEIIASQ